MVRLREKYPEWLVAEPTDYTDDARAFLIHTKPPRFICEVWDEDSEKPVLDELSFVSSSGNQLANFTFFDDPPEGDGLVELLGAAGAALKNYDEELLESMDEYEEDEG